MGASVSILDRDRVGACGQIVKRSTNAKVSAVYRVGVRRSSTRTRDRYTSS